MAGVSQDSLLEFASHYREPAEPGVEILDTARYRLRLQPDFPIAGPNSVSWIRCGPDEAGEVIDEVRALVRPRHLPIMWTLDPETEPPDFGRHLAAHGIFPPPRGAEASVMVLPIAARIEARAVPGLEIRDALSEIGPYRLAETVASEAFGSPKRGTAPEQLAAQERMRRDALAAGNRSFLLATVHGEPAGSAWITVRPPNGATINGGAVRPEFRGLGIYRALVAARLEIARAAGAAGLVVWGGSMSAPILERYGFRTVGWRRFYLDVATA